MMVLIAGVRYTEHGSVTKKTIRISGTYMALSVISGTLTIVFLNPAKTSTMIVCLPLGLLFVFLFVGAQYLSLTIAKKGLMKMFAPLRQFLKRLFLRSSD